MCSINSKQEVVVDLSTVCGVFSDCCHDVCYSGRPEGSKKDVSGVLCFLIDRWWQANQLKKHKPFLNSTTTSEFSVSHSHNLRAVCIFYKKLWKPWLWIPFFRCEWHWISIIRDWKNYLVSLDDKAMRPIYFYLLQCICYRWRTVGITYLMKTILNSTSGACWWGTDREPGVQVIYEHGCKIDE
jgi:hypothetical protein